MILRMAQNIFIPKDTSCSTTIIILDGIEKGWEAFQSAKISIVACKMCHNANKMMIILYYTRTPKSD